MNPTKQVSHFFEVYRIFYAFFFKFAAQIKLVENAKCTRGRPAQRLIAGPMGQRPTQAG